jgi:farnesyl diphosphate synthase
MVVGSLTHLAPLSPEMEKEAFILGWCVELLQACFLVADDIMDKSTTRRGKACWYLKEGVGLIAINDSLWLESYIYEILRHFIKGKPYYLHVVELFQEVSYLTKVGQCLDTIAAPEDDVDLDRFTPEKHAAIVKYKTAFYSFYLPVGIAMYMVRTYVVAFIIMYDTLCTIGH